MCGVQLLGVDSNDIDVATDDCMGEEFANSVKEYLCTLTPTSDNHDNKQHKTGSIGIISANPEQSKHLETATMKVFGQEIDFVNLRSEEYTDTTSRIPTVTFGTPEQDAYRRDFTVNSLFFNVMTQSVEDYTLLGLIDLQNKLIRTPLPALTTFRDDPLRLLRAVRFASRYNFKLDDDILLVGKMPEIHNALQHKISKERIFKEISGCFSGTLARPLVAVHMMQQMQLFPVLFAPLSTELLIEHHARVSPGASVVLHCDQEERQGSAWGDDDSTSVDDVLVSWQVRRSKSDGGVTCH